MAKKKSAQIKMFETIAVLIVFFFLLTVGIVFYFNIQKSTLQKESAISIEKYAFQTALKIFHLPELDCSFLTTRRTNCIDKLKILDFSEILSDDTTLIDYFGDFGFSTIKAQQAWPLNDPIFTEGITLYDNIPLDNKGNPDFKDKLVSITPVLLFDAWHNEYSFGIIEVQVYVQ